MRLVRPALSKTLRLAAAGMVCLIVSFAASGAATLSGESANGYGRLLLSFEGPAAPAVSQADGVLVIRFAAKTGLSAEAFVHALPGYVTSARADADGRAFRLALAQVVRLHSSRSGAHFALDLLPAGYAGMPADLPPPPPPAAKAVDVAALPLVKVRAGAYARFTRLVFDFARKPAYAVFPGSGRITIRFETKVRPDFSALDAVSPPWVKEAGWRVENGATLIDFDTISHSGYHDFADGSHVVLDVLAPKTDADAYNPPGVDAGTAKSAVVKGQPDTSGMATLSAAQTDAVLAAAAKADGRPAAPVPAGGDIPLPAPRPDDAAAPAAVAAIDAQADATHARLRFPGATVAAAFVRGRNAFVVLDGKPIDAAFLKTALGNFAAGADVSVQDGVSILRIPLRQDAQLAVQSGEGAIIVELAPKLADPNAVAIVIARDDSAPGQAAIRAELPGAQHAIRFKDPDVGDLLIAVPGTPGHAATVPHRFVDFAVLPSASGLVLSPFADNLTVDAAGDRVRISRPDGLTMTAGGVPMAASPSALAAVTDGPGFIDFAGWAHPLRGSFLETERSLRGAAAKLPASEANAARRAQARFYIANDFGAEALGLIRDMVNAEPGLGDDPQLMTIKAAASVMMHRPADAIAALLSTVLQSDPNAALWRGLAYAQSEDWANARDNLARAMGVVPRYPPAWQARFRLAYANAAIAAGALGAANDALARLPKMLARPAQIQAELARARLFAARGRYSEAKPLFAAVAKGSDPAAAANAIYDDTTAALAAGAMDQSSAIDRLERLRYRWRGDGLELKTLRKLGALYFGKEKWREGLGILRSAVQSFPHADAARQAQDDMRAAFSALFLGGKADKMPPVQALGLFFDFIDLTPIGADGDEMIRRMSDRLVRIDLLGPAEQLLKYQVDKRLDGVAQSQIAAKLAMIYLMDHKPKEALAAIRATRVAGMPDEIAHDRLLLEARALAALKQWDQATDLIAVDNAPDTRRLRADIYWESGNWAVAAQKNEELLAGADTAPQPLGESERREVMRAAIAYSLASDDPGIARIRARFAAKMAGTPDASAFAVVTQSLDTQGVAFRDAAAKIASIDTLESFMKDFEQRFDAQPMVASKTN